jgi:threonine dehydrogenase-like Zn-dependent dehydrogenase
MEMTLADLIAGKFHVSPLITHRVPWREAAAAYERLVRDKVEDSLGIVIDWR